MKTPYTKGEQPIYKACVLGLIAGLLFSGVLGCSSVRPIVPPTSESVYAALQGLAAQYQRVPPVLTLTADVSAPGIPFPVQCRAEIVERDSLRMELWGPLGLAMGLLRLTRSEFQFYDILNNTLIEGHPRPELIAQLTGISVPHELLLDLLRQIPLLPDSVPNFIWDAEKSYLTLSNGQGIRATFRLPQWELAVYEIHSGAGSRVRAHFTNWIHHPQPYAEQVLVETPRGAFSLRIREWTYSQLPSDSFLLNIPPNATRVVLE
ncbi:MAG: DUF4292 domain-containing protein [Candidatus Kapabacteria bacterium]|nr:DUF4292 domain-containing protein [Candidatus Kapabacteria bacterium]MCS7169373.1 DUF4292 domain-containing protein [Candidatus Kapabacteria bacterium]MDW7996792.1 hypothetical protein [Bacteroidota bacterium]MDW8225130.1 hypothetical protein [Bacteroidota bacterium]